MDNKARYEDTAQEAGRPSSLGQHWAAVRREETRLQCLVAFLERIHQQGLVSRTEEVASARRRFAYLVGPTSVRETKKWLLEKGNDFCWRDKPSEKRQARISMVNIKDGLDKARKESWRARKEAATWKRR